MNKESGTDTEAVKQKFKQKQELKKKEIGTIRKQEKEKWKEMKNKKELQTGTQKLNQKMKLKLKPKKLGMVALMLTGLPLTTISDL